MRNTVLPIALIVFGAAWLAREMGWFREIHMLVALGFIALGVGILVSEGVNRSSIVTGPILAYVGAAWIAHDQGIVSAQIIWPVGVILLGVLMFVARMPGLPDGTRRVRRARRDQTLP
jgi:hypothetical protein